MRKAFIICISIAALIMAMAACKARKEAGAPTANAPAPPPYYMPLDLPANPAKEDEWTFAWQTFTALNWPADPKNDRGRPDITKTLGDKDGSGNLLPTVWLGYAHVNDVFQSATSAPDWNAQPSNPCPAKGRVPVREMAKVPAEAIEGLEEAGLTSAMNAGPLVDQNGHYVLFQTLMNRSQFHYIASNGYYDADEQISDVRSGLFVSPPADGSKLQSSDPSEQQGAVEIKAAWRVLDGKADPSRYYTIDAQWVEPDGKSCQDVTLGLIGFHILRLTPSTQSTWFWATFEHVDNVDTPSTIIPTLNPGPNGTPKPPYPNGFSGAEPTPLPTMTASMTSTTGTPVPVSRLTPIPGDVNDFNAAQWQQMSDGNVFRNYQLINTISTSPSPSTTPCPFQASDGTQALPGYPSLCTLANTALEPYTQTASCLTCHQFATPQGATAYPVHQIFTFSLQRALSSTSKPNPSLRFKRTSPR